MHRRGRDPAVGAARRHSRRAGQRLSLDPPGDPTVGACLAAGLSGPLRHRFGAPRDLVLGVTLVLADGTVVNAGGTVVKNVAGYDLGKLVCGSARATRLHRPGHVCASTPCRAAAATVVVETDDPAAVVATLLGSQLVPSAVDVLHPGRRGGALRGRRRRRGGPGRGAAVDSAASRRRRLGVERVACTSGRGAGPARASSPASCARSSRASTRRSYARPRASPTSRTPVREETPSAAPHAASAGEGAVRPERGARNETRVT